MKTGDLSNSVRGAFKIALNPGQTFSTQCVENSINVSHFGFPSKKLALLPQENKGE